MAFAVSIAQAAPLTVVWTEPTTRVQGVSLQPSEISNYTIVCGDKVTEVPANTTSFVTSHTGILPGYGVFDCYMTTVDTTGLESSPSDTFSLSWLPPSPPIEIRIIIGN